MAELREYQTLNGQSPFARWFTAIDAKAAAKVNAYLTRVSHGNFSRVEGVGAGVFECRIDYGPGYRVYFGKDGEKLIILLVGGTKKTSAAGYSAGKRVLAGLQETQRRVTMALTRKFKDTVQSRALRDAEFRRALLTESIERMLEGDLRTGKAMLRDYINATIGFEKLASQLKKSPKSVMRMFSDSGNPRAENIFSIISTLGKREGIALQVTSE